MQSTKRSNRLERITLTTSIYGSPLWYRESDMFSQTFSLIVRTESSVASSSGGRYVLEMCAIIILLILNMSGLGSSGSLAKCGVGPIRDFGELGTTYADIHCVFYHVCWHQEGLLFNLTEGRVSGPWPIMISGSSVPFHHGLAVDITPLRTQTLDMVLASSNVDYIENAILLRRFLPDNLFHVLHDDILPVYALKESLPWLNLTLFATESRKHRFDEYYALLRLPTDFAQPGRVKCFHKLFVGLPKVTLWYQYGFRSPQSILHGTDLATVRKFVDEVSCGKRLHIERKCTILTRKSNRRLLNLEEIKAFLTEERRCSVAMLSIETSFVEIREVLSKTDLLIAMHGAELSLVFLLPVGAVVIEMFPYAINSSNHTPYKRFSELLGLIYEPWENKIVTNNIAFPEKWLSTLPANERLEILNAHTVKPHLCCADAAWLFRIYQDTRVDLDSFRRALQRATSRWIPPLSCSDESYFSIVKSTERLAIEHHFDSPSIREWERFWKHLVGRETHQTPFFYPGRIRNARCSRGPNNRWVVTWRAPVNFEDMTKESSYFEIISQCRSETVFARTSKTSFIISPCNGSVSVWVRAHGGLEPTHPTVCEL